MKASFFKMRNGGWGVRLVADKLGVKKGTQVDAAVQTKAGAIKHTLVEVFWTGANKYDEGEVALCKIVKDLDQPECMECNDRYAITKALDSSGIEGDVCNRCAKLSPWERSFA